MDNFKRKNLLIFPAGSEIGLEIFNALKYSKFVNIYGGTSAKDHSYYVYKNLITDFPYIDDNNFLEFLNRVIIKYNIDCIYPAHDSASVFFSDNRDKIKCEVVITDSETTNICRDKQRTYQYFNSYDFIPRIYNEINDITNFPVFIKPKVGQGSNGTKTINNIKQFNELEKNIKDYIICEYLPGEEYTIDCFTDKNGKLLVIKTRRRNRIRNGIAVNSEIIKTDNAIIKIANIFNDKLKFKGAWFFQIKKDKNNNYKLLEISPRIPGTNGLTRNLGINFPLLTLFVFWGYDVDVIDNNYKISVDRSLNSIYKINIKFDNIFIDYDDTLIIDKNVNEELVKFLYQSLNENKKIFLITKHDENDIYIDLKKFHIDYGIFDKIICIKNDDEKFKYIDDKNSIFIDDSFSERIKINNKLNIPVFDLDMIESLIRK